MKLIGYLNECDEPVIKEMSERDIEYCEIGGLQLLYASSAKDIKQVNADALRLPQ